MRTIFIDMDGVVADWETGAANLVGYKSQYPERPYPPEDWEKIRTHQRIFRDLPKMELADEMIFTARKFRDDLGWNLLFLTAVPHYNDIHWAYYDKVMWAHERYPDIPVHFGPYSHDKRNHAKAGDILVDDRKDNCEGWQTSGGIAVRVTKDYSAALNELNRLFTEEYSKVRNIDSVGV